MKITGQLEWADYLKAQLLHIQLFGTGRLGVFVGVAFFGCLAGAGLLMLVSG